MSEPNELMHEAAEILRDASKSPKGAHVIGLVAAVFWVMLDKPSGDTRTAEEFMQACLKGAEMLSPQCPHCGGSLKASPKIVDSPVSRCTAAANWQTDNG
jgi:hypothetical protein